MKKIILIIAVLFLAIAGFSQKIAFTYPVADTAEYFGKQIDAGNFVYVASTGTFYRLEMDVNKTVNMRYVLASTSRYSVPMVTEFQGATIVTTGAATIGGNLTAPTATIPVFTTTSAGAATVSASVTVTTPYLQGVYTKGTHSNFVNDSATNVVASGKVKTPYVWCTGSSGAIFTATDGSFWKLVISSNGTATYVTVTP